MRAEGRVPTMNQLLCDLFTDFLIKDSKERKGK